MKRILSTCIVAALFSPGAFAQDKKDPVSPNGLVFQKWSGAINVPDPVACTVDPKGRVYVSATTRRKVGDLDIREHTVWVPDDVSFTSVEDKKAFYHSELAPGKMRSPRGGLTDRNRDGSIDWKDLTNTTERIYQLRDTDGDGTADKMTVFAEGFNTEVTGIAAGVLYHDGWVYATITPDLWRLKDTDDDGVADVREVVAHGFGLHIGYAGHDMHGLSVGPDGRIYWSIGDKGVNAVSREGRRYYHPNEGCVLRVEPDGSGFEVFAHGLRNPQEPVFDELGDLFAVDNDADFKGEMERFVYIPEASDSGWRNNYQYMGGKTPWMRERLSEPRWDGQAAYLFPPLAPSTNGPAGFKRDPGTALSDDLRGMFFLNEFPSGHMRGFRVEQDGASFKRGTVELLHQGVMGIGLSWHPDGALFFADWAGGYPLDEKGAIWRADVPGGAELSKRKETLALLSAGFSARPVGELTTLLAHADQRVRQGAQLALAARGEGAALLAAARKADGTPLSRIHGIWGCGQLLRKQKLAASEVLPLLGDAQAEIRAQAARVLSEAKMMPEEARKLIPLLADAAPRVRFQAAIAMGRLREATALEPLLKLAEKEGADPVMRHAAVTGLTGCATAAQLAAQAKSPSLEVRLASVVALRRQAAPEAEAFLHDAEVRVISEAARAIYDNMGIPAALPALAAIAASPALDEPAMLRAVNAALRVGTVEAAERLIAIAIDASAKKETRAEALAVLLAWKNPPRLDRADGYGRKFAPASIEAALTAKLDPILALTDAGLKTTAVQIVIAHSLKAKPEQIAGIVADKAADASLRAEALRLMSTGDRSNAAWKTALDIALADASPEPLRGAAREFLLPDQPERLVAVAEAVLKSGRPVERQQVIALLARAAHAGADAVLDRLGKSLVAGQTHATLQLDVLEALQARAAANPSLGKLAEQYTTAAQGVTHRELLEGGSAVAGLGIVQNNLGANCLACHAITKDGSTVGPNLENIGTQRDRAYLLESLLSPSAAIAPGYGIATYLLRDKTDIAGTPIKETPEVITVRLPDGKERNIQRSEIASQTPPVSVMPPMLGILKPREVRDVVAFLVKLIPQAKKKDEH